MARKWNKLALLAKRESSYGTDPTPTGSENAMLAIDVRYAMLEATEESRNLALPYMGHQGVMLTGVHARLEFSIELAGAGTAGTVPAYGPLLRACGMSETIVEESSVPVAVAYAPVSGSFDSVSLYYNRDGVNAVLLGARGNWTLELTPSRIPRFRFNFIGLDGTMSDTALPTVDLTDFVKPVAVSKANTTFSLHGYAGPTESIQFDLGNDVQPRMLVNHESIEQVARASTGRVVMQAAALATKNWKAIAKAGTTDAMAMQHGTVAGNIVKLAGVAAQIGRPEEGETQGIVNNTLPVMYLPTTGNNELVLTVE